MDLDSIKPNEDFLLYQADKASHKKSGIEFSLTFDEWYILNHKQCSKCGLSQLSKVLILKLPSDGYVSGNVYTLCCKCNDKRLSGRI